MTSVLTTDFSVKTANWEPPKDLPQNWKIIRQSEDGAAYRSRNGLLVMISCCVERDGRNWVHLSVSRRKEYPSWDEFSRVKDLFLGREALALQVLPPRSEWVNDHAYCLHLYQCLDERVTPDFRKMGTI